MLKEDYNAITLPELEIAIEEDTEELEDISTRIATYVKYDKQTKLFNIPYSVDGRYGVKLYDYLKTHSFDYKRRLHSSWEDPLEDKNIMTDFAAMTIYVVAHIVAIFVYLAEVVYLDLSGFEVITLLGAFYIIFELICGGCSIFYYVVRPNLINRKIIRRQLKKLWSQEKILKNKIKINENMISNYKLANINPNEQFTGAKLATVEKLRQSLVETERDLVDNIADEYKDKYNRILNKCNKLLDLAEENGQIVTEISKIYNIYITEINKILVKADTGKAKDVLELLDGFESYIDRKLNKFRQLQDMSLDVDIAALKNAFTEDV